MHYPVKLLTGHARSGKNTVSEAMCHTAGLRIVEIALADPMKRLAANLFGFSEAQLWGPSENRNAVDHRFDLLGDDLNKAPVYQARWHRLKEILKGKTFEPGHHSEVGDLMTIESWLCDVLPPKRTNIVTAGEMDYAHNRLWDWARGHIFEQPTMTPRFALQTLGTEWGRHVSRDIWIEYGLRIADKLLGGGYGYSHTYGLYPDEKERGFDYVVITDGRFRNEILSVRKLGGEIWRIDRPGADGSEAMKAGVAGHASEQEQKSLGDHLFDVIIENVGTKEELVGMVQGRMKFYANASERMATTLQRQKELWQQKEL